MTHCANVGSKPSYRCGCTDDTPCRLGDAGSMTFLPWFVPRTEPPVHLREVGPDRGHLLTESCGDVHLCVCRCRPGNPPPKYHCLYWRYLCSIEGVAAACIAAAPGVASARAAVLLLLLLLRVLQQHEEVAVHRKPSDRVVVEQDCVSSGYWGTGFVSWAESSCPTESRREKTTKNQQLTMKKSRQRTHMDRLVRDNTRAGPSNPRASLRNCGAGPYRARV